MISDKLLQQYKWQLLALFAFLLILIFFGSQLKAILIVSALALIGAFGQIYKRYIRFTSAVEFVTFGTVVVAIAYGPLPAVIFALAVSFAAEVISGNIDAFMLVYLPVRVFSGVFAAFVPFAGIAAIGLATTLFINFLSQPIYLLQGDAEIRVKGFTYLAVNVTFNILLFNLFGNFVLRLT